MKRIIRIFKNLKFKQKLSLSYILVCFIPLITLGSYSYYLSNTLLLQQANQNQYESITQISNGINSRIFQYEAVINSITENFKFEQIFSNYYDDYNAIYNDYVDPFFSNILDFNKDILQISVFTENNKILRGEYILPMSLTKGFLWAEKGKGLPGTQWYSKNKKILCTRWFSNKHTITQNKFHSLLFLSIDTDRLFSEFDNIKNLNFKAIIVDKNRNEVLEKGNDRNSAINANTVTAIKENINNGYISVLGKKYMIIVKSISENGWKIYYFVPVKGLLVHTIGIVGMTAVIIIICIILLFIIIWLFSSTFVRRINKLNKKMELVEKGNLTIEVSSKSKDEIGELTNRFGNMLNNINVLIDEAYHSKIILKEAEIKALQSQINPHFLYNTLSIINWKALKIDALEISHITTTVSKFYRTVLNKGKNTIMVRDEIENAKAYVEIQLVMHDYSFEFEYNFDEDIYNYRILNLVLQPVIENAIEHGIDLKRKGEERGRLILNGYSIENDLEFSIEDNGPGMEADVLETLFQGESKGYGLKNIHQRIIMTFGKDYGVRVISEKNKGTKVYIKFPKN